MRFIKHLVLCCDRHVNCQPHTGVEKDEHHQHQKNLSYPDNNARIIFWIIQHKKQINRLNINSNTFTNNKAKLPQVYFLWRISSNTVHLHSYLDVAVALQHQFSGNYIYVTEYNSYQLEK